MSASSGGFRQIRRLQSSRTYLRPDDFEKYRQKLLRRGISGKKGLGVHALDRSVRVVKAIFNHAYDAELIDNPIRFGNSFKRSSSTSKRKSRSEKQIQNGKWLFELSEAWRLIATSEVMMFDEYPFSFDDGCFAHNANGDGFIDTEYIIPTIEAIPFASQATAFTPILGDANQDGVVSAADYV